jgi:hypothetical protein
LCFDWNNFFPQILEKLELVGQLVITWIGAWVFEFINTSTDSGVSIEIIFIFFLKSWWSLS